MNNNYDKVQNAELSLRNVALENSSLDNLIQASLNPQFAGRNRVDSLQNMTEQTGRKRAMTMDGPVKNKFAKLNHKSGNSAFVSFKMNSKNQNTVQETKDEENSKEAEMKIEEPKLNKKRTHAVMEKDFPTSHQQLLSQEKQISQRKRARSL